ncbi:MAG TPA: hypothetical protein VMF86_06260 [Stellaceae bacterium]|nr:hypothetical protein [Stellaceae bacterium]
MQNTARRRDPDDNRQATQLAPAALDPRFGGSVRLRSRNRILGLLLASVAVLGFAIVILLAVMLRYGQSHHLIAGL